jgi:hypothetical protein
MGKTIAEIHKAELLTQWLKVTKDAIVTLVRWQRALERWQAGGGGDLEAEIDKLDAAGLGEWAEWGTDQSLDELAEVLTTPSE